MKSRDEGSRREVTVITDGSCPQGRYRMPGRRAIEFRRPSAGFTTQPRSALVQRVRARPACWQAHLCWASAAKHPLAACFCFPCTQPLGAVTSPSSRFHSQSLPILSTFRLCNSPTHQASIAARDSKRQRLCAAAIGGLGAGLPLLHSRPSPPRAAARQWPSDSGRGRAPEACCLAVGSSSGELVGGWGCSRWCRRRDLCLLQRIHNSRSSSHKQQVEIKQQQISAGSSAGPGQQLCCRCCADRRANRRANLCCCHHLNPSPCCLVGPLQQP